MDKFINASKITLTLQLHNFNQKKKNQEVYLIHSNFLIPF